MEVPIWLVPIFAVFCASNRIIQFVQAAPTHPAKYLWLAKAIVDIYFAITYIWIASTPAIVSLDRANAVRIGVLFLFSINSLAVLIERNILYHFINKVKSKLPWRANA
jgi:hypothetical protein